MQRGDSDLRARLRATFAWRDGGLLRAIGPALGALFPASPAPTVVLGPESRGCVIGPLVATHLAMGFVEVRKNRTLSPLRPW